MKERPTPVRTSAFLFSTVALTGKRIAFRKLLSRSRSAGKPEPNHSSGDGHRCEREDHHRSCSCSCRRRCRHRRCYRCTSTSSDERGCDRASSRDRSNHRPDRSKTAGKPARSKERAHSKEPARSRCYRCSCNEDGHGDRECDHRSYPSNRCHRKRRGHRSHHNHVQQQPCRLHRTARHQPTQRTRRRP